MANISVKQLKIKVDTNMSSKPFELTFSKIHNPIPFQFLRKANISEYPFFTPDKEYPEFLKSKLYKDIVYVFFDKQEFIRVIVNNEGRVDANASNAPATITPEEKMRIGEKNIMTMLQLLFPINYPIKNNLNTSYNKYLIKKGPDIQIGIEDVVSVVYSGNLNPGKPKYSYLKTDKGVCTISEVIWLNDILSNKQYRGLVDEVIKYTEWAKTQHTNIDVEISTITKQLQEDLTSPSGKLYIGAEEIVQLQSEKRIYNPDDMKEDIKKIMLEYVVVDSDKKSIFTTELDKMVDSFLQRNILDKPIISQFTRFKDKFDFTYNSIPASQASASASEKPSPPPMDDLFFLHKRYNNEDIDKIKSKNSEEIAKMNKEIAESTAKIAESNKIVANLTNEKGYTETKDKTTTFVFTVPILKKYVNVLQELIKEREDDIDSPNGSTDIQGIYVTTPLEAKTHITNKIKTLIDFSDTMNVSSTDYPYLKDNILINNTTNKIVFLDDNPITNKKNIPEIFPIFNSKLKNQDKINADVIKVLTTQINTVNTRIQELEKRLSDAKKLIEDNQKTVEKQTAAKNVLSAYKQPTRDIFILKTPDTASPKDKSLVDLKYDLATQITEIQDRIFKGVIVKYNRFKEIGKTNELIGRYAEIDTSVDTMVDEINKLNTLIAKANTNTKKLDTNDILNITEKIKSIFDKLTKSTQINISRTIGEKIAKILQLSNQIQILNALEIKFFPEPPTGIFVNYEKDLDKTASITDKLLKEINLPRYSNFKEIVAFIKKEFLQNEVESLNIELNKLINNYFANKSNKFYDDIVLQASEVINQNKKAKKSYDDNWNVSITTLKSSTSKGEVEYQISLYIELIEGELNEKNQTGIKCQFLDEELTKRFEALIDNDSSFEHTRTTQVFNIKDAEKKIEKKKQEHQAEIEKAKSISIQPEPLPVPPIVTKGGKTKRAQKKVSKNNTTCKL